MRRNAHRRFGTGLINAKDEVMALSVYGIGATRDRRHRDVAAGGGHDHDGSDIALLKRARHRRPHSSYSLFSGDLPISILSGLM